MGVSRLEHGVGPECKAEGKRDIPEKTHRLAASPGTFPTMRKSRSGPAGNRVRSLLVEPRSATSQAGEASLLGYVVEVHSTCQYFAGMTAVAERLARSPLTKANQVQFPRPGHYQIFRKWESLRAMPLIGGFPQGSPVSIRPFIPALLHTHLAAPLSALKTSLDAEIPRTLRKMSNRRRQSAIGNVSHLSHTQYSGRDRDWKPDALSKAILAVKEKGLPVCEACRRYGVPRRTLRRYLCDESNVKAKFSCKPTLSAEQELCSRIFRLCNVRYPLTSKVLQLNVFLYCSDNGIPNKLVKGKAGRWWLGFVKRNFDVAKRKAPRLNAAHTAKLNRFIVTDHFDKLKKTLLDNNLMDFPEMIYTMDEKGYRLQLYKEPTVFAKKGAKRVHVVTKEHGVSISVVACGNATESVAEENYVLLYCLPSNTTHELQPLDKGCFRSFEIYWDQHALLYFDVHKDENDFSELKFGNVFTPTWEKSMSQGNMKSGFKGTGIYPFNPLIIPDEAFAPSAATELPPPEPATDEQDIAEQMPPESTFDNPTPGTSGSLQLPLSRHTLVTVTFTFREHPRTPATSSTDSDVISPSEDVSDSPDNEELEMSQTPDSKQEKETKKNTNRCKTQATNDNSDDFNRGRGGGETNKKLTLTPAESWYCIVCGKDEVKDKRRCAVCGEHIHEESVDLCKEDKERFVCPTSHL
ncbi:hypothetical protein PR048_030346 [Dryococelus australis]|uniref:HTH psq-type domain-containing protein n=1 Tax=Dryococelus australis TaxID=614101 RepID=A0ABQ9G8R1_9NEOP|nr:hypothetical protein PR048_030346 [Dryococelus australis]